MIFRSKRIYLLLITQSVSYSNSYKRYFKIQFVFQIPAVVPMCSRELFQINYFIFNYFSSSLSKCACNFKLLQHNSTFLKVINAYLPISFIALSNFYTNFICQFLGMWNLKCLCRLVTASWWNYTNNFRPIIFCYSSCW